MSRKFQISKEELEYLYLNKKISSIKISKIFNISKTSVLNKLKKYNIKRRNNRDYIILDYDKIIKLYNEGNSINKIADDLRYSPSGVYKVLKSKKIKIKGTKGVSPKNKLNLPEIEIIKLYKNRIPTNIIAKRFNTSHQVILKRLYKFGINTKDRARTPYSYKDKIITKRGDLVISYNEKIIADWLLYNGVVYIYDKRLPDSKFKCDFYLPNYDIYIEYFGLIGKFYYDKKIKRKLQFYMDNNLKLFPIYPKDDIIKVLEDSLLNKPLIKINQ